MNINISSGVISYTTQQINENKKILILGKASSSLKAREIRLINNLDDALSTYGDSDLYNAFKQLYDLNIKNVYLCNCYSESDYIRIIDKVIHYDFDYLIPINLYLSDTFYNPITDNEDYYFSYFIEQLSSVNSLTTVIATDKHADLYEDFDHYIFSMEDVEKEFIQYNDLNKRKLFKQYGNNLNFVYNNLKSIPFANVILGALYCNRDYSEYFASLNDLSVVYNIDNFDVTELRAMYFRYNYYNENITLENPLNFKTTNDIYANALIDDVIKRVIRQIDMGEFKGRLFNPYTSISIESKLNKKLRNLKGTLFKSFEIEGIDFITTDVSSGYIQINFTIVPYGSIENINVIMGVV